MKTILIYVAAWFGLVVLAVMNGTLREKGYGPYDNNTTYLEIVYVGGSERPTYFLHPDFITGGDVAAPPNSRYQGLNLYDLGKPNTWPARIQVNVSSDLDVEEGRARRVRDVWPG